MISDYDYLYAYGASSAYSTGAAASVAASGSYLDITGGVSGNNRAASDSADISSTARELIDRIKSLDVFSCIYPDNNPTKGVKSLFDVENDFMSDFTSFASAIGGLVGSSGTVTMGLDGKGGMLVEGDDASSVGAVSSSVTSTSTARFAVMAARAALMDAGNTVDGFSEAYAADPYAAIRDNIDALGDRLLGFRAQVGGGAAQYGFMRDVEIEYSGTTVGYGDAVAATAAS